MARRKTGRRRGRPRQAHAKRRTTTRQGRRTGVDPRDDGTAQLRARKRRATMREDLPLDGAGVLLGRGHLDGQQYSALAFVTALLQRCARAWGGRDGSVEGLWRAVLAAGSRPAVSAPSTPHGADAARRRLAGILRNLDGSKGLIVALAEGRSPPPEIILRLIQRRLTAADLAELDRLRDALDTISGYRPGRFRAGLVGGRGLALSHRYSHLTGGL